jgi:hypothetical protein
MRRIVGTDGAAGGHGTMAGARLFTLVNSHATLQALFVQMVTRLCEVLGHEPTHTEQLLIGQDLTPA